MAKFETVRLTTAQATIRFLINQYSERDGKEYRLIPGTFGIFGHGNVCGIGQALLQNEIDSTPDGGVMEYYMPRNEQGAVHAAAAFAKAKNRLQTLAVTTSIGPGALNMVTGAALATTNRVPVLLLPSDQFATRYPDPVLQQLEDPRSLDVTVNDAFRCVSRFFDRINRPEQLMPSLMNAMRVLTDPAETGAVVLAMPQDVQAEAFDWPVEMFEKRVWHVRRPAVSETEMERAAAIIKSAKRPLIVSGGGTIYAEASQELRDLASATGIPVSDTQAGKGAINFDHECAVGGVGSTGANSANHLADKADVVIGVGTRYSDFTTASHTQFKNPDVRFVNINVKAFDAAKHAGEMVVADAKLALAALKEALGDYRVDEAYSKEIASEREDWFEKTAECYGAHDQELPAQTEVFGALNDMMGDNDVVINAAGSMPGDLQCLWQAKTPVQYHVEYAFSCMGYEIPAAMGVKMALPDSEVVAIVGDGTYQMLPMELATVVQENIKVIYVLLQNYGFSSIGSLSESRGSQRFGTRYRMGDGNPHNEDGELLPVDIAKNAESWGIKVLKVHTIEEFRDAYRQAEKSEQAVMIHIETNLFGPNPPNCSYWDVVVPEVSRIESTQQARKEYEEALMDQRHYWKQ
ncbi:3D-(3,5/4)-trihydroxycyclohexane-1,2-dione acylhydrolase (decyclizing) [Varibaculum cambriense]|uniref:3D-(3,5/4)-trihydroxycyclohexane-1,2-dione acylhydrolase (decyclizing) n=1 Tax=Varibaculum cambriense TaxID=184870 RepID=UPI002901E76C|nr:3D-(3,5/4)-trihydroxycyclohexane-1,2-dione acylhydrolase (decyclizing) [Varibaculum cambriense]MDU1223552.1 3D-(3,5/4)-trihydroxycyclohexane-1,2-dione acylhydrolase (decyclizing) [Varibaculum cambriense]MDU3274450.1 3D-(3,5/4)-trihydroxycyclohexane-1,2-dione acylhydrolase (decyclizing) [Varibaculum cambriense]